MKKKLIALVGLSVLALSTFAFAGSSATPTKAMCGGGSCCGSCAMSK